MTLIAKFDCQDGIVVPADSQETAGDYRVEVNKIKPIETGNYELLVGGSGYIGELIDGMNDVLADALSSVPSGQTESQLGKILKSAIVLYHRQEVQEHPASRSKKRLEFIICVRDVPAQRIFS